MTRLLHWLVYVLGFALLVTGLVTLVALWVPLMIFQPLKGATAGGVSAAQTGIFVALAGVLVALGGNLLTQARNMSESIEGRSRFYLDSCVMAYEEARKLLWDGNNDRAKWIAAARALKHARRLAEQVVVNAHRRVLEVHELKYRGFFHDLLKDKPATFFYGSKDMPITTEDAAKLSTAQQESGGRPYFPKSELSEKSLYAIWEAARFPEEYRDPLRRGFSDEDMGTLLVLYPGLHEFLEHTRKWQSAAGKLYPRENECDR